MLRFFLLVILAFNANADSIPNGPTYGEEIVGGTPTTIENYPYQVAIIQSNQFTCGGSIIGPFYVLTAAHCVQKIVGSIVIHAGSTDWSKPKSIHQVIFITIYGQARYSDLSVLRVREKFYYDKTRQPIPLPKQGEVAPAGQLATVVGWGIQKLQDTSILNYLQAVQIPLVDRDQCSRNYSGTVISTIYPGEICAGISGKGTCRGDSGGALVYNGRQFGIVSRGLGCADPRYPGIYSDVAYYSGWIAAQIKRN